MDETSDKYQAMIDWIARDIEVTTLRYQTIDDMVEAIGLPREKLCLYCWNGESLQKDMKANEAVSTVEKIISE